ncbi:MAG TPA: glycosyl hydrolase [Bacillota bacterium]|nr:glycosyl hydrolase [Bacillota bacterium]
MYKKLIFFLLLVLVTVIGVGCGGSEKNDSNPTGAEPDLGDGKPLTPGTIDATPCNTNASEAAKNVLKYLATLTERNAQGVISGQNCGHGNEITTGNYLTFIETLHQQTGQYVGMIGIDYEYQKVFSPEELLSANTELKNYWKNGGLVTINWSPTNPWSNSDPVTYADIRNKYPDTDLNKLITPGSSVYKKWMATLDRIAAALDDLNKAGVVVLWRPMQEMNGIWFWWGKVQTSDKNDAYTAVWRHMYDYFTNTKGLNNLLWVFSPNYGQSFSSFPYPGKDYVDIIGGTQYSDQLIAEGYNDYLAYRKPVGMAEYGPADWETTVPEGALDNRLYIKRLKQNYPRVAYWVTWHSWPGVKMAIVDNQYAKELMNDPYMINRGMISLTK